MAASVGAPTDDSLMLTAAQVDSYVMLGMDRTPSGQCCHHSVTGSAKPPPHYFHRYKRSAIFPIACPLGSSVQCAINQWSVNMDPGSATTYTLPPTDQHDPLEPEFEPPNTRDSVDQQTYERPSIWRQVWGLPPTTV